MDSRITGKNDKKNDEKVKIILYIGGIDYEKRNMKMTSAVLAAALAAVSLAGCGGSGKQRQQQLQDPQTQQRQKLVLKLKAAKQQAGKQRKAATR